MDLTFRITPEIKDVQRVREIVASTEFFYDFEIDVAAELVEERLSQGVSSG